jgi:hypothetical protein
MHNIIDLAGISEKNDNGVAIPIWMKGTLFIIGLLLMCSGVLVPQFAWCLDSAQREAFVASLPLGESFENDGSTYVWLPTLRAEKTDARKDKAMEDVVERKGLFSVYKQLQATDPSIRTENESAGNVSTYPVVYNPEMKSIGIITGKLWLKLKNMQDASFIADMYSISLSFVNNEMETAFYNIPGDVNIQTLRKQLEADSRVLRVTLDMVDIIQHLR